MPKVIVIFASPLHLFPGYETRPHILLLPASGLDVVSEQGLTHFPLMWAACSVRHIFFDFITLNIFGEY